MLHAEPIHLARELVAELLKEILTQQLVLQCSQDASFDFIAPDGQMVVASSLIASAEAREPVSPENRYCGRFATPKAPAVFIACRVCF